MFENNNRVEFENFLNFFSSNKMSKQSFLFDKLFLHTKKQYLKIYLKIKLFKKKTFIKWSMKIKISKFKFKYHYIQDNFSSLLEQHE